MQFGALRVLNDDIVAPGMGFGAHGHENMEIISIPIKGELAHKDSMGTIGDLSGRSSNHVSWNRYSSF